MKPLQKETDFTNWKRRIYKQLETFDLWKYIESTVPIPISQENEDQDDFAESFRTYKIKKSQTMYLLENTIHNDVFSTLWSHSYNLKNRNPKILIDTLSEILTKTTTCSIQTIKQKFFTLNINKFDNFRYYLNQTTYLKKRANNVNLNIIDKLIQIILLEKIQKTYIQLYFNLTYESQTTDYITIFKTFQSFANNKV